jgi:cytochrome c2
MKVVQTMAVAGLMLVSMPVAQAADAAMGEKIFEQVCSHCHNTTAEEKIGPGLAGITQRRPVE